MGEEAVLYHAPKWPPPAISGSGDGAVRREEDAMIQQRNDRKDRRNQDDSTYVASST